MNIWLIMLGMGLVTYGLRVLPLVAVRVQPNPGFERFLQLVPPAVFAALIFPDLLFPGGKFEFGPALLAGAIGLLVAWRSQNVGITILAGLGAFAILHSFM